MRTYNSYILLKNWVGQDYWYYYYCTSGTTYNSN